jgi:hypothetical protein
MVTAELSQEVRNQIAAELESGERIRWQGQPVVGASAAKGTWAMFIFAIPWTAFAVFWTLGASGLLFGGGHANSGPLAIRIIFPLFGLPFIAVGVWMLTMPARAKKKIARMAERTAYVITDRRAIIFDAGFASGGALAGLVASSPLGSVMPEGSLTVKSYRPAQLQQLARVLHKDGTGDIIFEEATVIHPVQNHSARTMTMTQSTGFKGIQNVAEVERMLKKLAGTGEESEPPAPPVLGG